MDGESDAQAAIEERDLPPMFRGHDLEVPYTAEQLRPTLERLRAAVVDDLGAGAGTPQQRLAAAWTRIAELRLPRKAVPAAVLAEIERLVEIWDRAGTGGIARAAFALGEAAVAAETQRIRGMLALAESALVGAAPEPRVPSE